MHSRQRAAARSGPCGRFFLPTCVVSLWGLSLGLQPRGWPTLVLTTLSTGNPVDGVGGDLTTEIQRATAAWYR